MYSQKVPFWTEDDAASNTVILPAIKALSAYTSPRQPLPGRWIQAKRAIRGVFASGCSIGPPRTSG